MKFDTWTHDNESTGVTRNFRLRFWRVQLHLCLIRHHYPNPSSTDRLVAQFHTIYDCKQVGRSREGE